MHDLPRYNVLLRKNHETLGRHENTHEASLQDAFVHHVLVSHFPDAFQAYAHTHDELVQRLRWKTFSLLLYEPTHETRVADYIFRQHSLVYPEHPSNIHEYLGEEQKHSDSFRVVIYVSIGFQRA